MPQVHGALLARLDELEREAERRLGAVTGKPAASSTPPPASRKACTRAARFTPQARRCCSRASRSRVAHVTNLVEKRLHRLLDSRFSGLPEQLARVPGRQAGAVSLHKAVVALAVDNRLLAAPASVHATDTSTGQEDVQAFTFLVAERLDRALSNLETALAFELTALRHAAALRSEPVAAPALAATLSTLTELVAPLEEDRTLGPRSSGSATCCGAALSPVRRRGVGGAHRG